VACELPEVNGIFLIGTPINKYDFGYLRTCDRPILFLHGAEDEHGSVEKLEKLVPQVRKAESVVVTGADHFFSKQLDTVDETIRVWAEEVMQSS
jgi:alpha/beta superfamily hydrolase